MIREQMVLEVKMLFFTMRMRGMLVMKKIRYSGSRKQLYFPYSGYRPGRERERGSCHTFADTTHYISTSKVLQSGK